MGTCEICGEEEIDLYSLGGYAMCKICYDNTLLGICLNNR